MPPVWGHFQGRGVRVRGLRTTYGGSRLRALLADPKGLNLEHRSRSEGDLGPPHVLGPRIPRRIAFHTNINILQVRIIVPHKDDFRGFGRVGVIGFTHFIRATNIIDSG